MVAVPEALVALPAVPEPTAEYLVAPVHRRRVVAVVATAMELLRPESDLLRIVAGIPHVDVLLAEPALPTAPPCAVRMLAGPGAAPPGPDDEETGIDDVVGGDADGEADDGEADDGEADDGEADDGEADADEVRAAVDRLGVPGLHLHRLTLPAPLGPPAEPDLVAALSELVGFDPEPGVYCLAPAPLPGDAARLVVDRAAQRIAQVYGIPLLRYRCLELSVVEPG